jgi:hypothetical protein
MSNLRLYLYIGVLGLGAMLGYWGRGIISPSPSASVDSSDVTIVRETVVKRQLDGTIVEKRKETEKSSAKKTIVQKPIVPKWSAGYSLMAPITKWQDYQHVGLLYRRIGETNLWTGGGYATGNYLLIGLRIDF